MTGPYAQRAKIPMVCDLCGEEFMVTPQKKYKICVTCMVNHKPHKSSKIKKDGLS